MSEQRTATIGCQLAGNLRHYEVISPEHCTHPGNPYGYSPEPPEWGRCWQVFEAESPARAKAQAVQCADFASWFDNVNNPFKGLRVKLFRCPHGACMGCIEGEWCPECEVEMGLANGRSEAQT